VSIRRVYTLTVQHRSLGRLHRTTASDSAALMKSADVNQEAAAVCIESKAIEGHGTATDPDASLNLIAETLRYSTRCQRIA